MAALVDHAHAHLALVALLAQAPDEVPAVRAEGGLPQEGGHELVRVHLVHPPLHGPPALLPGEAALLLLELPHGLRLLLRRRPLQLDLQVQLTVWLEVNLAKKNNV